MRRSPAGPPRTQQGVQQLDARADEGRQPDPNQPVDAACNPCRAAASSPFAFGEQQARPRRGHRIVRGPRRDDAPAHVLLDGIEIAGRQMHERCRARCSRDQTSLRLT